MLIYKRTPKSLQNMKELLKAPEFYFLIIIVVSVIYTIYTCKKEKIKIQKRETYFSEQIKDSLEKLKKYQYT